MIMKWRLSVAAIAALIALGGTAEAGILTAGPAYGGAGGISGKVVCWLFNTGNTTVTVSSRQIFSTDGGFTNLPVSVTSDGCKNPLGAEKGCQFSASASASAVAYTCRAVISGVEENVGGTMQILSPTSQLMLTIPMKK
jgi:hypothetical protein